MKKPENFYEFCDSLNKPYSLAKQYFDDVILEIDVYNDSQYFYEWFSSLDDKSQDTTYNNLQKLYDTTKATLDFSFKQLKKKIPTDLTTKIDEKEMLNKLEKSLDILKELGEEEVKRTKLSILNQLLATADSYRRTLGAVEINECEKRCSEHNKKYEDIVKNHESNIKNIHKKERNIMILSLLSSVIVSSAIMLILLYIFAQSGSESFVTFVDNNLMSLFIGFFITLASSVVTMYIKIIKDNK